MKLYGGGNETVGKPSRLTFLFRTDVPPNRGISTSAGAVPRFIQQRIAVRGEGGSRPVRYLLV
jgi:hypothetical protein